MVRRTIPCSCYLNSQNQCVPFTYQISTNTTQATAQGISEAKTAISKAQSIGLNPTVIYKDIENYTPSSTCSPPVRAFLNGWDQQMKTVGQAGVYGNPAPAADFAKASPIPDDVWIAKYASPPQLTIWGLGTPADSPNWTNGQRIHQVQQNLAQAWSATSYNVDPDIENATVVNANAGSKAYSSYSPSSLQYPGACETFAYGINDVWGGALINGSGQTGQIVGEYIVGDANCAATGAHAFLLDSNVQYSTIDYPGAVSSFAYGINNLGQIVGTWIDAAECAHGYLYNAGTYTSIDNPNANCSINFGTYVTGINDAGQIVGFYYGASGIQSFVYYGNQFYPISLPGSCCDNFSGPGINGDAAIAGSYNNAGNYYGFVEYVIPPSWTGSYTSFFDANGLETVGVGINNNGDVAGYYEIQYLDDFGLLYTNGVQLVSFQYSPGYDTYGFGVNDFGQMVGYYRTPTPQEFGFVASLQP